ncbi:Thioredoxin [Blattella germanica]|nr:Thioredoxin [Blattella germanica]
MAELIRNLQELDDALNSANKKLVVVEFYARNCEPCRKMRNSYQWIIKAHREEVVFLKADVNISEDITSEFQIAAWPTFLFMKMKQVIDKYVGSSVEELQFYILKYKNY